MEKYSSSSKKKKLKSLSSWIIILRCNMYRVLCNPLQQHHPSAREYTKEGKQEPPLCLYGVYAPHSKVLLEYTSARNKNKAERFQRLSCLLVIPTPSLSLQTIQHKSLGRHSAVAAFSMFLETSSTEWSIVSLP